MSETIVVVDSDYPDTTLKAKEKAETNGFAVIVATDYMLQLDLDTAADLAHYQRFIGRISDLGVKTEISEEWNSKSGNKHVLITLSDPIPLQRRIAIQALLGSDRKRELLAMRGALSGAEFPVMLFRPQGTKKA